MLESENIQDATLWVRVLATVQQVFSQAGQYEQAVSYGKRAFYLQQQQLTADQLAIEAIILNNIGADFNNIGQPDSAEWYLIRATEKLQVAPKMDLGTLATTLHNRSFAYFLKNDLPTAAQYQQQALEIGQGYFAPQHPMLGRLLHNMAMIQVKLGNMTETIRYATLANQSIPNQAEQYPGWYLQNVQLLMSAHYKLQQSAQVEQWFSETQDLFDDYVQDEPGTKMDFYTIATQIFIKLENMESAKDALRMAKKYLLLTDIGYPNYEPYKKAIEGFEKLLFPQGIKP